MIMKATSYNDMAKALYETLEGKSGEELSRSLKSAVKFLYRRGLLSEAREILAKLEKLINEKEGRVTAVVSSPKGFSGESRRALLEMLKKRYSAKEVDLREVLDEKLLGGFRIEAENEVIDTTIKGKINQLQGHLTR